METGQIAVSVARNGDSKRAKAAVSAALVPN
jgi:hypothetical protein